MSINNLEPIDNSITSFTSFYEYIVSKCKKGYYNMLLYRHLGDTFVMAGLKGEFESHYHGKLHYLVKPSQEIILKQFGITEYTIVDLNKLLRERIRYSNRSNQDIDLLEEELYVKIFTSLPMLDVPFLGSHVRYVREVLKWDNFVNAWAKMFGLNVYKITVPYYIPDISKKLKAQLMSLPPIEKLVLLAPELQSFHWVPEEYWHQIVLKCKAQGFTVVTNCLDPRSHVRDAINLDLSVSDIIALGMRCQEVHSIRSGLCDILAAKGSKLYVYYTQEMYNAYPKEYFSLNECYNLKEVVNEIFIPDPQNNITHKIASELNLELRKFYNYMKKYRIIRKCGEIRNKMRNVIFKIKAGCRTIWRASKRIHLRSFSLRTLENIMYAMDRWHDPLDMRISQLGDKNANKIIYYVKLPEWWVPTAGFFALLNKTLCAISFADRMGLEIVVGNWNNCAYEVDPCITGTNIVFEYYFNPLSEISNEDVLKSKNVCFSEIQNIDLIFKENGMDNWFLPTKGYLIRISEMYKKYIHLNEYTKKNLLADMQKTITGKKILGVHYRGTDYILNCNGHPISVTVEDYIAQVKEAAKHFKFDQIFIATDDLKALEQFQKEFNNIVFYSDTYRTQGDVSVAYKKDTYKPNGYQLGYEVLRDAYTLATCNGLIGGKSQVCYGAQTIKYSLDENYEYLNIIDKGINENKNDWLNVYNRL